IELWVEDEGPGLSNTGNLFVPFFTTKPGGSGIGLVLSRQIAEAHGGRVMSEDRTRPILAGTAATDYERYLRTDELLSLQKTPAEVVHRDEHLFQTVHQASELWLKLAGLELDQAASLVAMDALAGAIRLVRRANDSLGLITAQLHMLEH